MTLNTQTSDNVRESGHPFLCFLNTVDDNGKTRLKNSFAGPDELAAYLIELGYPAPDLALADDDLHHLLAFRETAFRALSAIAAGRPVDDRAAHVLQDALKTTITGSSVRLGPDGLSYFPDPGAGLKAQVVLSMEGLLRAPRFERLRECRRCTRLFLDHGRGKGRRWCSMSRCGNRAKAEAYRARKDG